MRHSFSKTADQAHEQRGFTIVELLIVIVVIAILAAIVIVAYNGIQSKAISAGLTSDLEQASKKLEIAKVGDPSSAYPTSLANASLSVPSGVNYTYTPSGNISASAPQTYCLTATSIGSNVQSYHVATGGIPTQGPCPGDPGTQVANLNCPTGYITVPGSSLFGTSTFCVMKYEAKNASGAATSVAAGTPWVSISQTSAISTAQAACTGCHLITEAEWLTIAQNVLAVPSNWSGGSVGSGYIYSGHNDGAPYVALAADTNDANGYSGETNTGGNQRRTLTLTNGAVIWDLAGNVNEWTNGTIAGGQQPGLLGESVVTGKNWNNSSLILNGLPTITLPSYGTPAASNWTSTQGIGQLYSNMSDMSPRGFLRGGPWDSGSTAGVSTLTMNVDPSYMSTYLGFRVTR